MTGFLLVATAAVAGVLVSYNDASTTSFSLRGPPIVWSAGPDSSGNDYVASWTLSSNATFFSLTLRPVPEANVTWSNLTSLTNSASASYTTTVSATSLADYTKILAARLEFFAYGTDTQVASLDLKAASPSVSLGTLAAEQSVYVKAYIKLDSGTGQEHLPSSISVSLAVA